jgi:tRNA A-37 threonylcarbamoyl transferase component Bud32
MSFESLWNRDLAPLEPPNRRGDGFSVVCVVEAAAWPELGAHGRLYVKRQQAFFCRPAWNAFRRTPTLRRELRFIARARALGIAAPIVVRYEEGSGDRAVLVLGEIPCAQDLEHALASASAADRSDTLKNVGEMLAKLHCARVLHGAVYPKHVLITRAAPYTWLIDFEKARRVLSRSSAAERDLMRLLRHAPFITHDDLDVLLKAYDPRRFRDLRDRLQAARQARVGAPQY